MMSKTKVTTSTKVVLTLMLVLSLCAMPFQAAFAARDTSAGAVVSSGTAGVDAEARIVKEMTVANASVSIDQVYTFTFTGTLTAVTDEALPVTDAKFNPIRTLSTTAAVGPGAVTSGVSGNLFAGITGNSFPHAGEYIYLVSETAVSPTPAAPFSIANSQGQYEVRVYVKNHTSGLYIDSFTVDRAKTDDGTAVNPTKKIDPTPGATNQFKFVNIYNVTTDLRVSKVILGDYADMTKTFDYSLTITKATTDPATSFSAQKYDKTGVPTGASFTVTPGTASAFTLGHDEYIVVSGIGSGATYTVTETGAPGYTPAVAVVAGSVAQSPTLSPASPVEGDSLQVSGANITYAGGASDNVATFTNTYKTVTPTGILLDNLPFILLMLVGVGGLVVFGVSRKKRRDQE